MPRKKNAEIGGQAFAIACPACQSRISTDGKTLFEKSSHWTESESALAHLAEIEIKIDSLLSQLTASESARNQSEKEAAKKIEFLELQLKAANEATAAAENALAAERKKQSVGNEKGKNGGSIGNARERDGW